MRELSAFDQQNLAFCSVVLFFQLAARSRDRYAIQIIKYAIACYSVSKDFLHYMKQHIVNLSFNENRTA